MIESKKGRGRGRGRSRRRRGFTLIEVGVAGALLLVTMAMTAQALGWMAAERRAADRRREAVQEAANVLERLAARPWAELTPESARALRLSGPARRALPGGELAVDIAERDGLKRIAVTVRWRGRSGGPEAPARLTAWVGRREGGRP